MNEQDRIRKTKFIAAEYRRKRTKEIITRLKASLAKAETDEEVRIQKQLDEVRKRLEMYNEIGRVCYDKSGWTNKKELDWLRTVEIKQRYGMFSRSGHRHFAGSRDYQAE